MNSEYAAIYRRLYERHWWWRAREEAVLRVLRERIDPCRCERILDIGCGDGLLFDKLTPYGDVEGVEICGDLVSPDNPWRDRIHIGPFDETFESSGRYDVILMLDVLEHFAHPVRALQHARDLLAPGGFVLIHVPAFPALWTSHDDLNHHYTRYSKRSLQQVLHKSSLTAEYMQYTFYWTCPVKLAIRGWEWICPAAPQTPGIPPRLVNALCYRLCRLEQRVFARRAPGFGSSLLAVVRHAALDASAPDQRILRNADCPASPCSS